MKQRVLWKEWKESKRLSLEREWCGSLFSVALHWKPSWYDNCEKWKARHSVI